MDDSSLPSDVLNRLMEVIEQRRDQPSTKSYTANLLAGGTTAIAAKIVEEAREVVEAAEEIDDGARDHLIYEAADLVYHLLVMLGYRHIHWSEVENELGRRFGISGIDEKAARSKDP